MSRIFRAIALLSLLTGSALCQTPGPPPVTTSQLNLPLFAALPPVSSAAVVLVGNPGPQAYYYWLVANYTIGATSPAGPFLAINVPNTLSASNYIKVTPVYPLGAVSVDLLRTTTPVQPSGACGCAVATAVTSGTINDQSNSLSAYTVTPFIPNNFEYSIANEVISAGVSHLIERQNGAFVVDLSTVGSGGSVTNIATGTGLTGGPITTTGTISLVTPVAVANGGTGTGSTLSGFVLGGSPFSAVAASGTKCYPFQGTGGTGCDTPTGAGTVTSLTAATGGGIALTPSTITNTGTIGLLTSCSSNQVLQWSGTAWACASGGTGTVTGSGTVSFLPEWTGTGALGNSPVQDDGTFIKMSTRAFQVQGPGGFNVLSNNIAASSACGGSSTIGGGVGFAVGCWALEGTLGQPASGTITGNAVGLWGFTSNGGATESIPVIAAGVLETHGAATVSSSQWGLIAQSLTIANSATVPVSGGIYALGLNDGGATT